MALDQDSLRSSFGQVMGYAHVYKIFSVAGISLSAAMMNLGNKISMDLVSVYSKCVYVCVCCVCVCVYVCVCTVEIV